MINATERAQRLIGEVGLKKLMDAGIGVGYHYEFSGSNYAVGEKEIIGMVTYLSDGEHYPVIDMDENGYEIVFASSHARNFTRWVGSNNVKDFEVIAK